MYQLVGLPRDVVPPQSFELLELSFSRDRLSKRQGLWSVCVREEEGWTSVSVLAAQDGPEPENGCECEGGEQSRDDPSPRVPGQGLEGCEGQCEQRE